MICPSKSNNTNSWSGFFVKANIFLSEFDDGESPLKDTYQIKVKNIEEIKTTADKIKSIDKIAVVRYGEGMVEKMVSAFDSIKKVTYGVVIALVVVTILEVLNIVLKLILVKDFWFGLIW